MTTLLSPGFEAFLWHGFASANTLEDAGIAVTLEPRAGAASFVCEIDGNKHVRRALGLMDGIGGNKRACDGMFVHVSRAEKEEPRVTLVFVELKGKDIDPAAGQLRETLSAFRRRFGRLPRTRTYAVAINAANAPDNDPVRLKSFKKQYDATFKIVEATRHGPPCSLDACVFPA